MEELEEIEEDAGLGNGGLGRLAGKWRGECALLSGVCLLSVASQMLHTLDHAYRKQKGSVGGVQGVSWL